MLLSVWVVLLYSFDRGKGRWVYGDVCLIFSLDGARPVGACVLGRAGHVAAERLLETGAFQAERREDVVFHVVYEGLFGKTFDEYGEPVKALAVVDMGSWLPEKGRVEQCLPRILNLTPHFVPFGQELQENRVEECVACAVGVCHQHARGDNADFVFENKRLLVALEAFEDPFGGELWEYIPDERIII